MATVESHVDRDRIYDIAREHRRMIKQTLDCCTDPFVCRCCRAKLISHLNLLMALNAEVVEPK
jgi:hypothetical protein